MIFQHSSSIIPHPTSLCPKTKRHTDRIGNGFKIMYLLKTFEHILIPNIHNQFFLSYSIFKQIAAYVWARPRIGLLKDLHLHIIFNHIHKHIQHKHILHNNTYMTSKQLSPMGKIIIPIPENSSAHADVLQAHS